LHATHLDADQAADSSRRSGSGLSMLLLPLMKPERTRRSFAFGGDRARVQCVFMRRVDHRRRRSAGGDQTTATAGDIESSKKSKKI
jgi:hypothetical protein